MMSTLRGGGGSKNKERKKQMRGSNISNELKRHLSNALYVQYW